MPNPPEKPVVHAPAVPTLRALILAAACTLAVLLGPAPALALPASDQAVLSNVAVKGGEHSIGDPAAAYDPVKDRYLVVWASDHESSGTTAIWGRFVSAEGGPGAAQFKIANVGTASDGDDVFNPRVAFSAPLRRYYVVFASSKGGNSGNILGQWLSDLGAPIGDKMGLSQFAWLGTDQPQVVPNDARSGVSVVYFSRRDGVPDHTLFGSVVTANGPGTERRISPADGGQYVFPTLAVNESNGEVAVAAINETPGTPTGDGEVGIFRLSPDLATIGSMVRPFPVGSNLTLKPSIAWNSARNEYAVAWPRRSPEVEVWAARYSATLQPVGAPIQVSNLGPPGNVAYGSGYDVGIVASGRSDQYAAFWVGDTTDATHADNQYEAWVRPLGGDFSDLGPQTQLSGMGPLPGTTVNSEVFSGAIGYDTKRDRWLATWPGHLAGAPWLIYGRLFAPVRPAPPVAAAAPSATAPPPAPCPLQQAYFTTKGTVCGPAPAQQFSVGASARGGRLLSVLVTPTAKGQSITVRCVKRCGRRHRVAKRKARKTSTSVAVSRIKSRKGSTIEVRIAASGMTTRYRRYTVLGKYPLLKSSTSGCRLPKELSATC